MKRTSLRSLAVGFRQDASRAVFAGQRPAYSRAAAQFDNLATEVVEPEFPGPDENGIYGVDPRPFTKAQQRQLAADQVEQHKATASYYREQAAASADAISKT